MAKKEYTIRTMTREEFDGAVDMAAGEGWNPGLCDADPFYAADPNGLFVGVLASEIIGYVSATKYGDDYGFMGFYIVKPEYRDQGYGIQLAERGEQYLEGRTVGIDGVIARQDDYATRGFRLAHQNFRYEGKGASGLTIDEHIVELGRVDFSDVFVYDRLMFPAPRPEFLKLWIQPPKGKAVGFVEDGALKGYTVIRQCRVGYKIGPLFADTPGIAQKLFDVARDYAGPEEPIFLDTPESNPEAVAMAERHGMTKVFGTGRMYLGKAPELPHERIFGITSFELG